MGSGSPALECSVLTCLNFVYKFVVSQDKIHLSSVFMSKNTVHLGTLPHWNVMHHKNIITVIIGVIFASQVASFLRLNDME